MRTLNFVVNGQNLTKSGDFSGLIKGSQGYLQGEFSFDSSWDGCIKAAVFLTAKGESAAPIIDNQCAFPDDVTYTSRILVYVIGKKNGYQIKTNTVEVNQT